MNPVIFQVGNWTLTWYGVFIVGGAVMAAWLSSLYAQKARENPDHIWNILAVSLIGGIIGARLYHVISSPVGGYGWEYYRENPIEIIRFWNGGFKGLGIYGGLVGGVAAIAIYCWRNGLNVVRYLDFVAPNVLVAQAIGRMGNFVNQELFGPETSVPWAFHVNPRYPCQPVELPPGIQPCATPGLTPETLEWYASVGYHPTFFYEAGWNLLAFAVVTFIIWRFGDRLRRGDAVLMYLIAYPMGRFWVEMFRPDAWVIGEMATAQWIAIVSVVLSAIAMFVRHIGWSATQHPEESLAEMSASGPPHMNTDSSTAPQAT